MVLNTLRISLFIIFFSYLLLFQISYAQKKQFDYFSLDESKRLDVFKYLDSNITIKVNPILGFSYESIFKHNQKTTTWGFNISGKHKSGINFHFYFNDNIVYNLDYYNKIDFLNKQGRILTVNGKNRSEFSETIGSLTFSNEWLKLGIVKDNLTFGEGKNSKLILSNRAPSFPALVIELKLSDWLSINSLHGWLISGIGDSSKSYETPMGKRIVEHEKYFALHSFNFFLFNKLTLRLGETIIYSDRGPYLGYILPFVFFRSIDHMFTYGSDDSGNNGGLFLDGNFVINNHFKLYGSLFIDELSLSNLIRGNNERNQFGYLFGLSGKNILNKNFEFNCEYTRILPWVYSNWIPAQTYSNNRFPMGHYIGQNSDQIYFDLSYTLLPELNLSLSADYTRNGGISDIINQYTPPGEKFLYGLIRNILRLGSKISFRYFENIIVNFEYDFYNVKDEDVNRTPHWQSGRNHFISLRLFYGLDR